MSFPTEFRLDVALQTRARKLDEMRAIIGSADKEKRNLSRSENARIRALEAEVEQLDEQIRADNARWGIDEGADTFERAAALARRSRGSSRREGEAVGLKRSESMQAWAEQRGGFYGAAGDGLEVG